MKSTWNQQIHCAPQPIHGVAPTKRTLLDVGIGLPSEHQRGTLKQKNLRRPLRHFYLPGARRQAPGWPTRLVRCEKKSPVLLGISKLVKSCLLYLSTDYSMFCKLHPQSSCFLGISHFISDLSPNLEQILCAQVYVYQEYAYIIAYPYHMLYSCIRLSTVLHCLIYCIVLYYVILLHIIISNHIRSLACRTGK